MYKVFERELFLGLAGVQGIQDFHLNIRREQLSLPRLGHHLVRELLGRGFDEVIIF